VADEKNTRDFKYVGFTEKPAFGPEHKSAMAKYLTPEMFETLKDVKSDKGYTLSNVIMTGVVTPHLGVGATAGDMDCWKAFAPLYNQIIKDWHGYDPETQKHPMDLDYAKLTTAVEGSAEPIWTAAKSEKFAKYVKSTRIRAARNLSAFPLPAGAKAEDRAQVTDPLPMTSPPLADSNPCCFQPLPFSTFAVSHFQPLLYPTLSVS
jgi:hypothetical protein